MELFFRETPVGFSADRRVAWHAGDAAEPGMELFALAVAYVGLFFVLADRRNGKK